VSPGGGQVADRDGKIAGVVVQEVVNEMVAGSFGTGERSGVERQGPAGSMLVRYSIRLLPSRTSSPRRRARSITSCPNGSPASGSPPRKHGAH
jgi:hypothetical protein